MTLAAKTIIGTSGYSFADWVGPFYPPGMKGRDMFRFYAQHFSAVELNFTYYRLPAARTMERMVAASPAGFQFWVKANQETTHKQNRDVAGEFLGGLAPMIEAGKLAGVLLQFPQSFHRTAANRKYLAAALDDLAGPPLAVEFRHCSWADPAAQVGLCERNVTLVVPDAPAIDSLYRNPATLTTSTGYLRLHSRDASKWYAGAAERYDYNYSQAELRDLARQWSQLDAKIGQWFVFFNNCHHAQAAQNAADFRRVLDELFAT